MQKNGKLILVEGLCGTGKSTLAERLHRYLQQQGISSHFYDEGAKGHPVSLNWHAFFREEEYAELLERYPSVAEEIRSRAISGDHNYLIPYRDVTAFNEPESEALRAELKARELCWTDSPVATLSEFTHAIERHWSRFAERVSATDDVCVLEAVFLQHQIHDLLKHYQADDVQIEQHIRRIADKIAALDPVLIYLAQPSVREQQTWISSVRSKPHYATEDNISFMEKRKQIELQLLERMPLPAFTINNVNRDWDEVFRRMVEVIAPRLISNA
ncbi:adenylyl-sulfate kinase [Paenibacillus albus]|uniref:Adenylyl-sulfate kinase n=1 Tax=Paenibacillus albus TaxID=2495582 RepID=A0A3S8ZXZ0_9BACL|nr:adenylyl-sulfate kinase [Paenibacillus albus]AZN38322.1 adenylyl-sulfate kinase [Paenibacillus albus]